MTHADQEPIGGGISQKQFYDAMAAVSTQMQLLSGDIRKEVRAECAAVSTQVREQHTRLRDDIDRRFTSLEDKIDEHAKEDTLVEKRVTKIETLREEENKQSIKRGALLGSLAAIAVTGIYRVLDHFFGTP